MQVHVAEWPAASDRLRQQVKAKRDQKRADSSSFLLTISILTTKAAELNLLTRIL